jgi:hypothetical protein
MTKWYKLIGAYHSPPFIDPENLNVGLVVDINKKQDILIRNLLTNSAKASDIPFDSPTTTTYKIAFPPIIVAETRKAILKAGNTVPSLDEIPSAILKVAWPIIKPLILTLF